MHNSFNTNRNYSFISNNMVVFILKYSKSYISSNLSWERSVHLLNVTKKNYLHKFYQNGSKINLEACSNLSDWLNNSKHEFVCLLKVHPFKVEMKKKQSCVIITIISCKRTIHSITYSYWTTPTLLTHSIMESTLCSKKHLRICLHHDDIKTIWLIVCLGSHYRHEHVFTRLICLFVEQMVSIYLRGRLLLLSLWQRN